MLTAQGTASHGKDTTDIGRFQKLAEREPPYETARTGEQRNFGFDVWHA